jgi:hypothetical protein
MAHNQPETRGRQPEVYERALMKHVQLQQLLRSMNWQLTPTRNRKV